MKKPTNCPKCKSKKVMTLIYGLLASNYKPKDDEISGGCMPTDAQWHCADCHWEWGKEYSGQYEEDE